MEIKSIKGETLFALEGASSLKEAVEEAVRRGVSLRYALLEGADLSDTHLIGADLSYANLAEADLSGARLDYANLRWANLRGAELVGALCYETSFASAVLEGAGLKGANLERAIGNGKEIISFQLEDIHLVATRWRIWLNSKELHTEEFLNEELLSRDLPPTLKVFLEKYLDPIRYIIGSKFFV